VALNIADLVEHAADLVPERAAVICGQRRVTYAELDERANRLANHLAAVGVRPGDHVGVHSRNSIEMVESMLAAYKLRAVAINVNYRYTSAELRYVFDNSDLVALVHERRYAPLVAEVLPDVPRLRHVIYTDDGSNENVSYSAVEYETALAGASPAREFGERSPDDIYILYTGGTTGYPKGVLWRQEDVWRVLGGGIDFITGVPVEDEWQQARQGQAYGLVRLCAPPMIHGAAQWGVFGALFTGSTVVLLPQFEVDEIWRAVERVQDEGKPVIVSMGGYAASGGYYVAAGADAIWAEPNTITGSIGVVGGKLAPEGALAKIGVTAFPMGRGKRATMMASLRPWTDEEKSVIQANMEAVYKVFVGRVADGRKLTTEQVLPIAQGHVWVGTKGKELGLVDEIGGLDAALAEAQKLGGVPATTDLEVYPPEQLTLRDLLAGYGAVHAPFGADALLEEVRAASPMLADETERLLQLALSFRECNIQTVTILPEVR